MMYKHSILRIGDFGTEANRNTHGGLQTGKAGRLKSLVAEAQAGEHRLGS